MTLIYVIYILLMSFTVFLMFYSNLGGFVKASALTLSLLLGLAVQAHYTDQLGIPIQTHPSGEFVYTHHTTSGDSIKLWAWTEERGDRLYVFPYSQETAQTLDGAKDKAAEGQAQSGEFVVDVNDNESSPGLRIEDFDNPNPTGGKD